MDNSESVIFKVPDNKRIGCKKRDRSETCLYILFSKIILKLIRIILDELVGNATACIFHIDTCNPR